MTLRPHAAFLAVLLLTAPVAVHAQASDPAATTVDGLNDALIAAMKSGRSGGTEARLHRVEPAVERSFDIAVMTRTAVGPAWTGFAAGDQSALTKAFGRFIAATYAKNFDSYDGERFTIDPKVDTRTDAKGTVDKLVKSQLVSKSGAPTNFIYRMRQSGGGSWKIVDVFYNGAISQVAAQRSQFAATIGQGGAPALTKSLDDKTATLLAAK